MLLPELGQLGLLVTGQPFAAARVDIVLLELPAQPGLGDTELSGDRDDRPALVTDQGHRVVLGTPPDVEQA